MSLLAHWSTFRFFEDEAHFLRGKHGIFDLTHAADAPSCARAVLTSGGIL
jgi:hypothetical protein